VPTDVKTKINVVANGNTIITIDVDCLAKTEVLTRTFVGFGVRQQVNAKSEALGADRTVNFAKIKFCCAIVVVVQIAYVVLELSERATKAKIDVMLL